MNNTALIVVGLLGVGGVAVWYFVARKPAAPPPPPPPQPAGPLQQLIGTMGQIDSAAQGVQGAVDAISTLFGRAGSGSTVRSGA